MNSRKKVCVIGCGVSGLSSAFLLQKAGWKVTLISKNDPRIFRHNPVFASHYPAASVIPRSVYSQNLESLFKESQSYFNTLFEEDFPGLSMHEHFELFEKETEIPAYSEWMKNFELFSSFRTSFHPKHPTISIKNGWKYYCLFADWSQYFPSLLRHVLEKGATLEIRELIEDEIADLPYEHIVNCSGFGATELFEDPHTIIYRGHLLTIPDAPLLMNPQGEIISYNFLADKEVYKSEKGNEQDVYCYPRSDGWIFGGSRQEGRLDEAGNWVGEQTIEPFLQADDLKVPLQIYRLNAEIITNTFGLNASNYGNPKAKMGYRYIRKKEDGLRLESEKLYDKLFIHNYGHGGAGVTLSWGCAKRVVELLEKQIN